MRDRTAEFDEWIDYASEEDVEALEQHLKKRYYKWLLISLIPIVGFFTIGLALFTYNNYTFTRSRGHNKGSGIWRFVMIIWGLIIFSLAEVQLAVKFDKLGDKILGL